MDRPFTDLCYLPTAVLAFRKVLRYTGKESPQIILIIYHIYNVKQQLKEVMLLLTS